MGEIDGIDSQGTQRAASGVKKGQKYETASIGVYEILSDPFTGPEGVESVAYRSEDVFDISSVWPFTQPPFVLIVEPKYRVGDLVLTKKYDGGLIIVGVSSERDYEGDFAYLTKGPSGDIDITFESWIIGKVIA